MKISVVTVVYNGEAFLESAIQSVLAQDYPDVEYVVIDGASTDGTPAILNRYRDRIDVIVSEPDKGIYDAMNKGVKAASGDIIGILNADDLYASTDVISKVVEEFQSSGKDSLFGDMVYVKPEETDKVVRYYPGKGFALKRFEQGDMPPHPTFWVKREVYERHGYFKTDYRICADFELMLRFLYVHKASFSYLPLLMVRMRTGGVSTRGLKSTLALNKEIHHALNHNGIKTPMTKVYSKYFRKVWQLVKRPPSQ